MAKRFLWCICLLALLGSLVSTVSGCGNKGPLFLPDSELPTPRLDAESEFGEGTEIIPGADGQDVDGVVDAAQDEVIDEEETDDGDVPATSDDEDEKKSTESR